MDIKDVENLAELAKIDLSSEEKEAILKDMGGILEYVKTIEKVKVENEKTATDIFNIWREDLPIEADKIEAQEFSRDTIVKQFPDQRDGFLKVRKIL